MSKLKSAFVRTGVAAAMTAALAGQAYAMDFEAGDWKGSWTSTFSIGSSWRAHDISPALVGLSAPSVGITNIGKNSVDEGDLNYKKGDDFTTLAKLFTEVEMKNGDMGFLVRGKAWYDYTLKETNPNYGNEANGYSSHTPLNDSGLAPLQKYSGTYLLDAYVYDTFQVGGESLQVRVGNQVVNWGEALFIQGVNYINPIDVPTRMPSLLYCVEKTEGSDLPSGVSLPVSRLSPLSESNHIASNSDKNFCRITTNDGSLK